MDYAIIIGGGKIGYYLARSLINRNYEVCLLERNPATYRHLTADLGDVVMQGDGCEPLTLKKAGIERAALVIAATGEDSANLVACQMARSCFGRAPVIARVNNPDNGELFEKLGIHERINGTSAILDLISQKVGRTPVVLLGVLEHSNIEAVEIILDENSPLVGARLSDIHFPHEALIISVIRSGEALLPSGETVFAAGDVLIALIPREWESTLREFIV
jgi:trk system potassium uptake protein TrkA